MKTTAMILTAAAAVTCGSLPAQNVVFQQAESMRAITPTPATTIAVAGGFGGGFGMVSAEPRAIAGSPFSGTEKRSTLQVLGDGTRIERTETSQISRDNEGRTRMETVPAQSGSTQSSAPAMITIQDPVAGTTYFLNPEQKTASKLPMPKTIAGAMIKSPSGAVTQLNGGLAQQSGVISSRMAVPSGVPMLTTTIGRPANATQAPNEESLGVQTINGVLAKGSRTTITIPVGEIGNDRALQVINERWYSDDLQMVVKSSNSDPRFGTTTFELTDISRGVPDPSLFQLPADYTVRANQAVFSTDGPKQ